MPENMAERIKRTVVEIKRLRDVEDVSIWDMKIYSSTALLREYCKYIAEGEYMHFHKLCGNIVSPPTDEEIDQALKNPYGFSLMGVRIWRSLADNPDDWELKWNHKQTAMYAE